MRLLWIFSSILIVYFYGNQSAYNYYQGCPNSTKYDQCGQMLQILIYSTSVQNVNALTLDFLNYTCGNGNYTVECFLKGLQYCPNSNLTFQSYFIEYWNVSLAEQLLLSGCQTPESQEFMTNYACIRSNIDSPAYNSCLSQAIVANPYGANSLVTCGLQKQGKICINTHVSCNQRALDFYLKWTYILGNFEPNCKAVTVDSLSITGATYNGSVLNVTCVTSIVGDVTPTYRWTYNGNELNPVAGSRISISNTPVITSISNRLYMTVLFNPIQSSDNGTYKCIASDQNSPPSSMNISVDVLTQPAVSIQPLTQSVFSGTTVSIICTVVNNVEIARMVWYRNGISFNASSTFPDESFSNLSTKYILTRRNITSDTLYGCYGENEAGSGYRRQSNISVILPGSLTCNNETDVKGIHWGTTLQSTYDKQLCPPGMSGESVRYCLHDGVWREASYDDCVNETLLQLLTLTDTLKNGLAPNTLSDILVTLASVTNISDVNVDLQKRAVEIVADVLNNVVQISGTNNNITRSDLENFLEVASNMLDVKNSRPWKTIIDEGKDGASIIFRSVEQFSSIKARLSPSDNESVIKTNLFVNLVSMPNSDINFTYLTANESFMERDLLSRLFLPKAALIKGNYTYYVAAYFKNVSKIVHTNVLQNKVPLNAGHDPEINSDVISLQLEPPPTSLFHPLTITFKHLSENYSNPLCSFLRYNQSGYGKGAWSSEGCTLVSTSNDTSVCECNHLTNFAILMNLGPMAKMPPEDELSPLSLISSIGCGISIFCLLLTIILHIIVWRYVKSGRTSLLMSLCLALIISYSLFLAGVKRTENKNICLAVAALLHYFYLVVFFLMLAFGIEIAVTVVHVFASKSRARWLLLLACVLPAVTVGISLGVTKLNGYGNDNFCWLSIDDGLIWAFVGPAAFVIVVNFIIIIVVFKMMFSTSVMANKSKKEKAKTSLRALCVLLPITGLTWVFGILSVNEDMVIFQYLFAILNSLQGFFIFLFHCVLNHQLRNAVKKINDKRKRSRIPSLTPLQTNSSKATSNKWNSLEEQDSNKARNTEGSDQSIQTQRNYARETHRNNAYTEESGRNIEDKNAVASNRGEDGKISNSIQHKKHLKRTNADMVSDDSSTAIKEISVSKTCRHLERNVVSLQKSTKMSRDVTAAKKQTKLGKHSK